MEVCLLSIKGFLTAALFTAVFLAVLSSARSQPAPALPTPENQALQQSLLNEINNNLQCRASVITLQRAVDSCKAESAKDANANPAKKQDKLPAGKPEIKK